jgi:hypothetical protein
MTVPTLNANAQSTQRFFGFAVFAPAKPKLAVINASEGWALRSSSVAGDSWSNT